MLSWDNQKEFDEGFKNTVTEKLIYYDFRRFVVRNE